MKRLLRLGVTLALTGCTVGPNYKPPTVASPPAFAPEPRDVASTTTAGAVDPAWWNSFHDPELNSLITRLARQNLDLKSAAERVEQAREEKKLTRSAALPQIGATADYNRTRQSPSGFLSLITPAPGAPLQYNFFADALQASWDLDLFGRVRRLTEAAAANSQAAVEDRRAVALAAAADLAQDYMQLRGAQAREAILRGTLALADRQLALVREQFAQGIATTADVANTDAQRSILAALLPPIETEKASLINALGFLLAEQPRALAPELHAPAPQPPVPPSVPVGLPGDLVRRRPDVREAEALLHVATAQTGAAVASFYPDVTLSAFAGLQGLAIQNAFSSPSHAFNVGPSFNLPLYAGGRIKGTLLLRESEQRDAGIRFQRTVLGAWREADDALTAYVQAQKQRDESARAVEQSRVALQAAQQTFAEGVADQRTVLTSQAVLFDSLQSLTTAATQVDTALVSLYRALGGGWETIEAIH